MISHLSYFESILLISLSFIASMALTPVMRIIAIKINFLDRPNQYHKSHTLSVPYLGGLAIIMSVTLVTPFILVFLNLNIIENLLGASFFIPAYLLGIIGLVDDRKNLNTKTRLFLQIMIALGTATMMFYTKSIGNPTGVFIADVLISTLWIVGITNAINFFDNIDGGTAGTIAITCIGIALIAIGTNQQFLIAVSVMIFGSMMGFLVWNKSPAKIYLGDSGSLFLGFVVGVLTLRINPDVENKMLSFSVPFLLLAVPILDTLVAIYSRFRRNVSVLNGGRDHLSHRLLRIGYSKKATNLRLIILAVFFSFLSVSITHAGQFAALILVIAILVFFTLFINFIKIADRD